MKYRNTIFSTVIVSLSLLAVPVTSWAQTASATPLTAACSRSVSSLIDLVIIPTCFLGKLFIPTLYTLAVLSVILFITKYIFYSQNEEKRKDFRSYILYAFWGLFAFLAINGLIANVSGTLRIGMGGTLDVPQLPE